MSHQSKSHQSKSHKNKSHLSKTITMLRKKSKLTQTQLGKRINISKSCISAYELDSRQPGIDNVKTYAEFFGVTSDYLLGLVTTNVSPSLLNEEFIEGLSIGSVILMLKELPLKERDAAATVIKALCLSRNIKEISNSAR